MMSTRDALRKSGQDIREKFTMDISGADVLLPGLANLADEIVFGRVWARPGLSLDDRMLATLSALTSKQYLPQLKDFVGAALTLGLEPRLIQEVMLHCAMYAGIPSAINSLSTVRQVLKDRGLSTPKETLEEIDLPELLQRGQATMEDLHAERSQAGYADPNSAASGLYATAIDYLYGEIWNRPGISRRQRMICSVAAFTALQMTTQQRKFFRSALNVGLSKSEVFEIITQTGPYSGFPPALNALATAEEAFADLT